jgi:hypothetical protein
MQVDGQVSFEPIMYDRIFYVMPHRVRLDAVTDLIARDSNGAEIWSLRLSQPDAQIGPQNIHYGVLPNGFTQTMPKEGRPALTINSEYEVEISWGVVYGRTRFTYKVPGSKRDEK